MIIKTDRIIGIPGYKIVDNSFGVGGNHLSFVERFGKPRIIMAWEDVVNVDLLYLPGGLDISPFDYEETPEFKTSNQDVYKEFFFRTRLGGYIESGIPIFGVCLGAQMLAVHFGCKLTQDFLCHAQSESRWEPAHKVYSELTQDGKISKKSKRLNVNSHHHQGLTLNNTNDMIDPLWYARNEDSSITGDGHIIEGFRIRDRRIYGVQWHPEELYDKFSIETMNKLLAN